MSRTLHSQTAPTTLRGEVIAWLSQEFIAKSALRGISAVEANSKEDYVFGYTLPKAAERILGYQNVEVAIDKRTKALKTKGGTPLLDYEELVRVVTAAAQTEDARDSKLQPA